MAALVTLQFGSYSNFVGAHWWNIQERSFSSKSGGESSSEVLRGCLYREGQKGARKEVDYTPRMIAVGLPSRLHSTTTDDYEHAEHQGWASTLGWDGDVQTIVQETMLHKDFPTVSGKVDVGTPQPKETRLDSDVGAWSDCDFPRLHPQSLLPVPVSASQE